MMGILERRLTIERLLAAARQDDQVAARRAIDAALVQAERDGGREGSMIAGGLLQMLGGTVLLPTALLAEMPTGAVMEIEWTLEGLRLKAAALPPEVAELVRRLSAQGLEVAPLGSLAAVTDQAPPAANPSEDNRHARVRICNALRTFVQRHYDGEIRGRGFEFMVSVFGELFSMAIGVWAANDPTPDRTIALRFEELRPDLETRSVHYQQVAEDVNNALNLSVDPGEQPPADGSTRLH